MEFYRKKNSQTGQDDFYEVGTNRHIGPEEFSGGAGFTEAKPTLTRENMAQRYTSSPLGDFQSRQKFTDLVKETIQRKQGHNKDIQSSRDYWRTQQRDPMTFTDERLQLLDPAQQQSLREKRYATAGAHLEGLREEEKYRGTRMEDILGGISDIQQGKLKESKEAQLARGRELDIFAKREEAGLPISDIDYGKLGVQSTDNRTGGSLSWRNNNSGNLKFSKWQEQYGAKKDKNSAFAVFPSEEKAREAYKALLTSENKGAVYRGLTPNEAMLKWSSDYKGDPRAYNYNKLVTLGAPAISKQFKYFTNEEWNQLFEAQRKAEGWTEGTILRSGKEDEPESLTLTDAVKSQILASADMTEADLKSFGDMSYDDWIMLKDIGRETTFEVAIEEATKLYNEDETYNATQAMIVRRFGKVLNSTEIKSILSIAGFAD